MNCHLLYLIGQLRAGGSERQLFLLLRSLDRERYKPALAVWNFSESDVYVTPIRDLGIPLYGMTGSSRAAKLKEFRKLVNRLSPALVHSYSFFTNLAVQWGTWRRKSIAFGSTRSNLLFDKESVSPLVGSISWRFPRNQICNNYAAAATMRRSTQFLMPKQISVVRNGIDLEYFCVRHLPVSDKVLILGIGSLFPVKRWDRLIMAVSKLRDRGIMCFLKLIGDGPSKGLLKATAEKLGVSDIVEFSGYTEEVPSVLSRATFLVHPSDSEGCPNVVMEAMACGKPVIANNVGDVATLIDDGVTGFVINCDDDETLINRMVLLINDQDLRYQMGQAGRAKAEREFGLNRLVAETLSAYRSAGWADSDRLES